MMHKRCAGIIATALMLAAGSAAAAEQASAANPAAEKVAVQLCSACHGPGGRSISPTFPNLAGQQKDYIVAQLRAFKSKGRADPEAHDYMWGMAATIPDTLIEPLAEYYSAQPPASSKSGDPTLIAEGEKLFETGDKSRNIPPCAGCHGAEAKGQTIFPRLAGQHSAYIIRQLNVIQNNLRQAPLMHGIVTELKPQDMKAVAEFLQSK